MLSSCSSIWIVAIMAMDALMVSTNAFQATNQMQQQFQQSAVGRKSNVSAKSSAITFASTITSSRLFLARRKRNLSSKKSRNSNPIGQKLVPSPAYVSVESNGQDAWKAMDIVDLIQRGGVGVLPTETGYALITSMESKKGLERLLQIRKQYYRSSTDDEEDDDDDDDDESSSIDDVSLSLLCSDIRTIDTFCYGIDKSVFKLLKQNLPGPYTFRLAASSKVPKAASTSSGGGKRHKWIEKTIGIRMPTDAIVRYIQDELLDGIPLLAMSPIPSASAFGDDGDHYDFIDSSSEYGNMYVEGIQCPLDIDAAWCNAVDFIVDAGERPFQVDSESNDVDLTRGVSPEELQVWRQDGLVELAF